VRQLKRRIEKLESEQQQDDYSGLDLYYCLVGQGPPPPKGSYYDVALSDWFERVRANK
tara:strand:+ start:150 stop:323 length:174 start_codon:yes stop_codon:yes gene_type:complete